VHAASELRGAAREIEEQLACLAEALAEQVSRHTYIEMEEQLASLDNIDRCLHTSIETYIYRCVGSEP
jgi:hypothetical protein